MTTVSYQGIPGVIRPFKEYLKARKLNHRDEVVFYGVPGTCTPFVELLCYSVRSLPSTYLFVPFLNEDESRKMVYSEKTGFHVGEKCPVTSPSIIVLMNDLALSEMNVKPNQVKSVLSKHQNAVLVGLSFMHTFRQANWLDKISFNLLIDATVVVDVTSL
jgi:hypothetical protein